MAKTPEQKALAAEIARQTNAHIRDMAEALDSIVGAERPVGFFCECGCLGEVEATLAEYDAHGGAWKEGHKAE